MASPIRFATVAAALLLGACATDPTEPVAPADVAPLRADANVVSSVLESPTAASLFALGPSMDEAMGGSALVGPAIGVRATDPAAAKRIGQQLFARLQGATTRSAVADVIPPSLTGRTLVYDVTLQRYVLSDRTGAPGNGVRFALYAINPLTNRPAEPLNETGYVDVTRTVTGTSITGRVEAYAGTAAPAKVIDYTAMQTGVVAVPTVMITGFALNGTERLEFVMMSTLNVAQQSVSVNNQLTVPSRGIAIAVSLSMQLNQAAPVAVLGARIESPNGTLSLSGGMNPSGTEEYVVVVNGVAFATITFARNAVEPTIVDAAGRPLNAEQTEALRQIFLMFGSAFEIFDGLSAPVGAVIGFAI